MAANTTRTVEIVVLTGSKPNRAATAESRVSSNTNDPVRRNNRDTETTAIVRRR